MTPLVIAAALAFAPPPAGQGQPIGPEDATQRLVLEEAAREELRPIPLDPAGSTAAGVAYDSFRLAVRVARAAAAAGRPLESTSPELTNLKVVIVAFPRTIDGRDLVPHAIELLDTNRTPVARLGDAADADVAAFALGASHPNGSIASRFDLPTMRGGDLVRIAYRTIDGTPAAAPVDLPVRLTPPTKTVHVPPMMPAGAAVPVTPVKVVIQGRIDIRGRVRFPRVIEGPPVFATEALDAVMQWVFEPARINGAPVVTTITTTATFRSGG